MKANDLPGLPEPCREEDDPGREIRDAPSWKLVVFVVAAVVAVWLVAIAASAQSGVHREDDPAFSGHYGDMCLAVRQDSATGLAANGDYIPLIVDASGRLWTNASDGSGPLTVDGTLTCNAGSGTFVVGDGAGALNVIVDTLPALPAGSNNIGDVDVLTVPSPLSTAGNGTAASALRVTVASDSTGQIKINDGTDTALVSGSGSLQVTCDNCGAPATFSDNSAFTFGTSGIANVGFVFDDVAPNAVTENAAAAARISSNRVLYSQLRDAAGNERGANVTASNALKVDGSAVTQPVSGTVTVTDGAGALNVIVDSGTITANAGSGTFTVGDGSGALNVIVDSGTTAVTQATASNLNAEVQGDAAHDATVSGNPVLTGGRSSAAAPTDVSADGEAVSAWYLRNGAQATVVTAAGALVGGDATNGLDVDVTRVGGTVTVSDGAGALNVIVDSGTVTANQGGAPWSVAGTAADGAAVSGNPQRIAGKDGSGNTQDIITDTSGELQVDVLTLPANASVNVAQIAGATVTTGNGTASGAQRVTLASDSTGQVNLVDNEPINQAQRGGVAVVAGPCEREVPVFKEIDQTAGEQLVTGTASERIYICSLNIVTASAQGVALVSGTGSVCATSTGPIFGGTTAATGWNFAANGGIVLPATESFYGKTDTDQDNLCLLQSASGQISGGVTYVSIPNI